MPDDRLVSVSRRAFLQAAAAAALAGRADAADAPMPTRTLGRTGQKVSLVGLGGAHIGRQGSDDEAVALVRRAIDQGITFVDNAWDANDGRSEALIGRALRGGYRNRVFLMARLDGRNAETAADQLDESLRRLGTDHVDLLQFNEVIRDTDPDRIFADDGAAGAVVAARKAGKTRFIGFSGHKRPAIHLQMLDAARAYGLTFDAVQLPLNLMDAHFDSFEQQVLPRLVTEGAGVIAMKALGDHAIVDTGLVTPLDCWHYVMHLPVSVVVTGIDSTAVLEAALEAARAFRPLDAGTLSVMLAKTADAARYGEQEAYKTETKFDVTVRHPEWLGPPPA